jgi:hypothetical protein
MPMKRLLAITSVAAVALAVSLAPADAKWKKKYHHGYGYIHGQTYAPYGWNNGWTSRNVSGADPSFGNRAGINYARRTGRCVEDLGYGRFEYCGW